MRTKRALATTLTALLCACIGLWMAGNAVEAGTESVGPGPVIVTDVIRPSSSHVIGGPSKLYGREWRLETEALLRGVSEANALSPEADALSSSDASAASARHPVRAPGCKRDSLLNSLGLPLLCGSDGWTFPIIYDGDCPIAACMIDTKASVNALGINDF